MALFIDHVNTVLGKLRADPITSLSTDTTTEAYRAQNAVQRAVQRVWNAKQWSFKARIANLSLTSGVTAYMVPETIAEIYQIRSNTPPYLIQPIREDRFNQYVPNPQSTASPYAYRLFESRAGSLLLVTPAVVAVVSSSASDTTQTVLVKGIVSGSIDKELVSLSGTSPVSTTKTFSSIISLTKSDTTVGQVTLSSGAVTLGILGPSDKVLRGKVIRFYPSPNASITAYIYGFAPPPILTMAIEDTEIPIRWDYVIDQVAFALALQSKGKEQAEEFASQMNLATKFLEDDMASEEYITTDEVITPARWNQNYGDEQWVTLPDNYGPISSY